MRTLHKEIKIAGAEVCISVNYRINQDDPKQPDPEVKDVRIISMDTDCPVVATDIADAIDEMAFNELVSNDEMLKHAGFI